LISIIFLIILFNLVNIGQNNPGNNNAPTPQSTPSQTSGTNTNQQPSAIPTATNIPGVAAGNLDFSNFARSFGSMVQGIAGRFIPGATLVNPQPAMPTSTPSSSTTATTSNATSSTQNSNTPTSSTANNNESDTVTEQMLAGIIIFEDKIVCSLWILFYRTFTFIGRWS